MWLIILIYRLVYMSVNTTTVDAPMAVTDTATSSTTSSTTSFHELRRSRILAKPSLPTTLERPTVTILTETIESLEISFPPIEGADRYKIEYYQCGVLFNGSWILAYGPQPLTAAGAMTAASEHKTATVKMYEESIVRPQCTVTGLIPGAKYCFRYSGIQFGSDTVSVVTSPESPPIQICRDLVELGVRQLETEQRKNKTYANEIQRTLRSLDQQITENKHLTSIIDALKKECQVRDAKMKVTDDIMKRTNEQMDELIQENKRLKDQVYAPVNVTDVVDVTHMSIQTDNVIDHEPLMREIESLKHELETVNAQHDRTVVQLCDTITELNCRIDQLTQSQNKTKDDLDHVVCDKAEVEAQKAKVELENAEIVAKYDKLVTIHQTNVTELTRVNADFSATRTKLAVTRDKLEKVTAELEAKSSELAAKSTELAEVKSVDNERLMTHVNTQLRKYERAMQYIRDNKSTLSAQFFMSSKMLTEWSNIMRFVVEEDRPYRSAIDAMIDILQIMQMNDTTMKRLMESE